MKTKSNILLLLTAIIWGTSFVSQSVGADLLSPFAFNGIRTLLGAVTLLPVILVQNAAKRKKDTYVSERKNKNFWIAGTVCGIALGVASGIQTYAIQFTTAGKCGFITALYILFVPIISIFLGKKLQIKVVFGVFMALVGMFFLCLYGGDMHLNFGDAMTLVCSLCFAGHILVVDYYSPKHDGVKLSCLQFFVSGVLNCIVMLFMELPAWSDIIACLVPILYSGIMSCGVAYTLQVVAQRDADPAVASILLSFESVFAAIAGWIILGDSMRTYEIFGCLMMFAAIITAQLPEKKISKIQTNV